MPQARQGAGLQWEAPDFKAMKLFDYMTNVRSIDDLKKIYFHYHKTYGE